MNVQESVQRRRAVRRFKPEPVPEDVIRQILEAGRRAQSSKNIQPWQFVVVRERETLVALAKTGQFAQHLAGAAFGLVMVDTRGGDWGPFDLGQAAAQMQLVAYELGVGACLANIYEPDKAKEILGIPADLHVFVALSFGYPAPEDTPAKLGGRKPLEDVVHWERW